MKGLKITSLGLIDILKAFLSISSKITIFLDIETENLKVPEYPEEAIGRNCECTLSSFLYNVQGIYIHQTFLIIV
jgi:hypothetical protein